MNPEVLTILVSLVGSILSAYLATRVTLAAHGVQLEVLTVRVTRIEDRCDRTHRPERG